MSNEIVVKSEPRQNATIVTTASPPAMRVKEVPQAPISHVLPSGPPGQVEDNQILDGGNF